MNFVRFLAIACFWGGSFVAIKAVVGTVPPLASATLRVAVALIALAFTFRVMKKPLSLPSEYRWKSWLAGAFSQAIPFSFLFWGEQNVSPGMAGIGNGTVPIWTFILACIFLRSQETFTGRKVIGLLMGILGMVVIFAPLIRFGGTKSELLGTAAVFGMAMSYGIAAILNRKLMAGAKQIDFHANLVQQHLASLVILVVEMLCLEGVPNLRPFLASPGLVLAVLYLGIGSTAIAWILFYHLIKEWGALRATSVTYLVPVTAIAFDLAVYSHAPKAAEILGALAILSGVILIQVPPGLVSRTFWKALSAFSRGTAETEERI